MVDKFADPLLTPREAARHLLIPRATMYYWLREEANGAPLVHHVPPEKRGRPSMPFVAVVDLWLAGEPMDAVAYEYDMTREQVEAICRVAPCRLSSFLIEVSGAASPRDWSRLAGSSIARPTILPTTRRRSRRRLVGLRPASTDLMRNPGATSNVFSASRPHGRRGI
jgi:hypothetical protein